MTRLLQIQNRQRSRRIDIREMKRMLTRALVDLMKVEEYELGIHLVGAGEMASINETFLQHEGSTDVITFNHAEVETPGSLHGELYVCVDEAAALAPRFRTSWQAEVLRYSIHGFLHLQGHDDQEPGLRRTMKREENRIVRSLRKQFAVEKISRNMRPSP